MTLRIHPRKISGFVLAIALLAPIGIACFAQAGVRADAPKIFGRVVAKSGEAVAGARVYLCSRVVPLRLDIGTPIELETKADARGRFRIEAPSDRAFTLWASWEDEDHATHVTELVTDQVVERPARLVEDGVRRQHDIALEGADAWREAGMSIRASTVVGDRFVINVDATKPRLPILPGGAIALEVRTRTGMLIAYESLGAERLEEQEVPIRVTIAKPTRITIRLLSATSGNPLENAWVDISTQRNSGTMVPHLPAARVGTTDQNGQVSFEIPERLLVGPARTGDNHQFLLFGAEDHAVTLARLRLVDVVQEFCVGGGKSLVGRVLDFDGNALANATLVLMAVTLIDGQPSTASGMLPRVLATDAKGGFRFDGLTERYPWELYVPGSMIAGKRDLPTHLHPIACGTATTKTNLGTIHLDQLVDVNLKVEHANATPAIATTVMLAGPYGSTFSKYITDREGRLRCLLPKGEWFAEAWSVGGGVARERIVPENDAAPTIRLSKTISISGRVVDERGQPIAGAAVMFWNRPEGVERELAELAYHQGKARVTSDATGRFQLQAPLPMARYELRATARRGERWAWSDPTKVDVQNEDDGRTVLTIPTSK